MEPAFGWFHGAECHRPPMTKTLLDPLVTALAEQLAALLQPVLAGRSQIRKRLLTVAEAAQYLGRSPKAIHALVERGKIPVVRVDSRRFFDVVDLERWVEKHKRHAR